MTVKEASEASDAQVVEIAQPPIKKVMQIAADDGANDDDEVAMEKGAYTNERQIMVRVKLPSNTLNTGKKTAAAKEERWVDVPCSASDLVQDVVAYLQETLAANGGHTIHGETCFGLASHGRRLRDSDTIGESVDSPDPAVIDLDLHLDKYTQREARLHLSRFYETLCAGDASMAVHVATSAGWLPVRQVSDIIIGNCEESSVSPSTKAKAQHGLNPFAEYGHHDDDLVQLLPEGVSAPAAPVRCLKSIGMSRWNPVPIARRQQGDLFYIAVETLEGQHFEVTASVHGFFVNESSESRFQPQVAFIAGAYAHSIVTLMQQLSPKFCASYVKLVECMTSTSPLATATPSAPIAYPWLARPEALTSHINDHGCADFSTGFLAGSTIDSVNLRDYNEELQQARDMPRATGHEQISRDRKLQQVYADFLDAATRGAMAVVRGDLLPMNPYDTPRAHMFLYNNIFFSFALDGRDVFARVGGDEAARASFGKDLAATRAWNDVDAEGLYTPATAMIDFGGHRLVAQSMVPGILRVTTDAASPVKYGYVSDDGKDLRMDPEFQRALEPVAKHLRIGKHTVVGLDGTEHEVCISPDCKGLLAGDGRRYMIELYRCTPVDIGFLESHKAASSDYPHQFVVLRLELVEHFYEHKFRAYLKELSDKNKASKKQQPTDELPATENDEALDLDGVDTALLDYQLALNPDVFTDNPLGGDATAIRRDEDLVRDAGTYLRDVTIPGLVAEWHLLKSLPMDSATLTNAMHRRGINMRYLCSMVSQVDKIVADAGEAKTPQLEERATFIKDLCLHEMVIRAAKHVLRDWLRMAPVHESSTVIAHFFNCLLGGLESIATTAPSEESVYTITAHDLWARVIKDVHRRFGYDLNMDEFRTTIRKSAVLRALCIAVGIQLVPRDYFGATAAPTAKLSASNTKKGKKSGGATTSTVELPSFLAASPIAASALFQPADIVSMVPVTKTAAFSSRLADETYASGKIAFAQAAQQEEENKKVDTEASAESPLTVGMELLRESLQLHEVVYGPLHRNTALVLSSLALAHLESDSDASTGAPSETALALQQQAVAAMERSGGSFDSHDVITQYMNLAYFYQRSKRPLAALQCMRHVARCWSVVYGGVSSTGNACGHPEKAVVDASVASMLEATGDFSRAKAFMMDALATNRGFHGEQSLKVAQGYHALAQTHGLDADYKQALVLEKQAYRILEQMVGPEHAMTKEIDNWLKQWTKLAVEAAMRAKEVAQAVSEGAPLEEVASASSTAKQSKKGKKKTTATSGR